MADAFLEDLEDLENDSDEEQDQVVPRSADHHRAPEGAGHGVQVKAEEGAGGDGEDEDDLDDVLGSIAASGDISSVATLRRSAQFTYHMQRIDKVLEAPQSAVRGAVEDDPEYQLIISCNELMQKIDDEILTVYKFVADLYGTKFPELESLVPNRLDYVRVVQTIGNEMDMTVVDLSSILPNALVISVSMTGSTTSGQPLPDKDLQQCMSGCQEALDLEDAKRKILQFVESRMSMVAPNICAVLDTIIAAQLMGLAGGLSAMSKIPACNLQVLGQNKIANLGGFGAAAAMPHTGLIYYTTAVQQAPPYLRMRALKVVAAKVALAARIDLHQSEPSGAAGAKLRGEIDDKISKWQETQQARTKKALPVPDEKPSKKRGGKRARKLKEKFGLSEIQKEANKRTFGTFEGEYGDDAMGNDFGMLGKTAGRLRVPAKKEKEIAAKKIKKAIQMSSGATNGLSSSLVFTPVQGLELAAEDTGAREARVRDANQKWFSQSSGFMSARPK